MVKNRRNISILLLTCHFLLLVGLLYSYFIASISHRYKIFYVSRHPAKFFTVPSHDHQLNWWHDFDPIRVFYQPRLKTHEDLPTAFLSQAAAKAALFFASEILFPRKRIIVFLHPRLIVRYVCFQLAPYILYDHFPRI